jgi:hypothetical protein
MTFICCYTNGVCLAGSFIQDRLAALYCSAANRPPIDKAELEPE